MQGFNRKKSITGPLECRIECPDFFSCPSYTLYADLAASCPRPFSSSSALSLIINGHSFKPGLSIFDYDVSKAVNHVSVEKFTIVTYWVVCVAHYKVFDSLVFDEFSCFLVGFPTVQAVFVFPGF